MLNRTLRPVSVLFSWLIAASSMSKDILCVFIGRSIFENLSLRLKNTHWTLFSSSGHSTLIRVLRMFLSCSNKLGVTTGIWS